MIGFVAHIYYIAYTYRQMINHRGKTLSGFTIVELLVVIVVIGVLATISLVSYTGISQQATISSIQSDLNNTSKLLKLSQATNGIYPSDLSTINNGSNAPNSTNATIQYIVDNSTAPQTFCITAIKDSTTYMIDDNSQPKTGDCLGNNLVAHLDTGDTNSYSGSGTTWTDLTGNGHNGTLVGGVAYDSGNSGSLVFDGVDDYVNIAGFDFSSYTDLSISIWAKFAPGINSILIGNAGNNTNTGFSLRAWTTPNIYLYHASSATHTSTMSGTVWRNLTLVIKQGQYLKLYVNGQSDGSDLSVNNVSLSTANTLAVGRYGTNYYAGNIGDIRIYSDTLSDTEILRNYNYLKGRYGL
jgi:prepilin-type N-terminal cleavage/methylation domain-containing protein